MGFRLTIDDHPDGHAVLLAVVLTRQETNELFLSGDSMVSWPTDGLSQDGDPLLARTSMFVSEIAAKPEGMTLLYAAKGQAERAAALLILQLDQVGVVRED
jgi:hypothetical protein